MKNALKFSTLLVILVLALIPLDAQTVGNPAPDFTLKNTEGVDVQLSSLKGKVVFLYLFGHGCPFCVSSGPTTQTKVHNVYGDRSDFQALGLDLWNGTLTQVKAFKTSTKITYPLLLKAGNITDSYNTTYDRVMVIDQEGVLRFKGSNPVSSGLTSAISVLDELLTVMSSDNPDTQQVHETMQVFPNPARDFTSVRFSLEMESDVSIRLLNSLGQEVGELSSESYPAGIHTKEIITSNLSAGLYFVQMNLQGRTVSRKLFVKR